MVAGVAVLIPLFGGPLGEPGRNERLRQPAVRQQLATGRWLAVPPALEPYMVVGGGSPVLRGVAIGAHCDVPASCAAGSLRRHPGGDRGTDRRAPLAHVDRPGPLSAALRAHRHPGRRHSLGLPRRAGLLMGVDRAAYRAPPESSGRRRSRLDLLRRPRLRDGRRPASYTRSAPVDHRGELPRFWWSPRCSIPHGACTGAGERRA